MMSRAVIARAAAADPVCPVSPWPTTSPAEYLRIREAEEAAAGHARQAAFYRGAAEDAERIENRQLAAQLLRQVGLDLREVLAA